MKKYKFIILLTLSSLSVAFGQKYDNPIAQKVTHPELKIKSIEITENNTVISLKVTNKRDHDGWFCADENIYIKNSKGTEIYHLIKSENIPTCPEQFKFSYVGQELNFTLYFPPISNQIQSLDLIEDCSNACFSFYGIILDNQHNKKIRTFEKGFDLYQENNLKESIDYFKEVIQGKTSIDSHIYGLSYYYLIIIYYELGDTNKMELWYRNLITADIKDKDTFIKELDKLGISN